MSNLVSPDEVKPASSGRFRLLSVHAHPDDEASKGAGTVHRYVQEGAEAVLVTCTGGEQGDILNPAIDTPENREQLPDLRRRELEQAADIIGYREVVMLGYRDSGMPDSEANADPAAFANADFDEAVGTLVGIIRATRPHVVLTYGDDQEGYPHPDHLQVHAISVPAFKLAGDPSAHPDKGDPWQPSKLYYSSWSRARIQAMHDKFLELGLESPFDARWFDRPSQDHRLTTVIDVSGLYQVRKAALHRARHPGRPHVAVLVRHPRRRRGDRLPARGLHPRREPRRHHAARDRSLRRRRPGSTEHGRAIRYAARRAEVG